MARYKFYLLFTEVSAKHETKTNQMIGWEALSLVLQRVGVVKVHLAVS